MSFIQKETKAIGQKKEKHGSSTGTIIDGYVATVYQKSSKNGGSVKLRKKSLRNKSIKISLFMDVTNTYAKYFLLRTTDCTNLR